MVTLDVSNIQAWPKLALWAVQVWPLFHRGTVGPVEKTCARSVTVVGWAVRQRRLSTGEVSACQPTSRHGRMSSASQVSKLVALLFLLTKETIRF